MKTEDNIPVAVRRPFRPSGCLIALSVAMLIVLVFVAWIYQPDFDSSTVERITIQATQIGDKENYEATINESNKCREVIDTLEQATLTFPCMCKGFARIQIDHADGSIESAELLTSHSGSRFFQIRKGLWQYRLSRETFGRILIGSGVSESKMFAYEEEFYREDSNDPTNKKQNKSEQATPRKPSD